MRWVWLAGSVVLVAAGSAAVWFVTSRGEAHLPPATASQAAVAPGSTPEPDATLAGAAAPAPSIPVVRTDESSNASAPTREAWRRSPSTPSTPIEGFVEIEDESGPTSGPDGSFVANLIDGPDDLDDSAGTEPATLAADDPRRVIVTDGCFRFDALGATCMLVEHLVLDGRNADVRGGVALQTDSPCRITGRWRDEIVLHVVDAATRVELDDVTVVSKQGSLRLRHPGRFGRTNVVVEHARSPCVLAYSTPLERTQLAGEVWVAADGHAWTSTELHSSSGPDVTVALGPAATLVVDLTYEETERRRERTPRLRLRDAAAAPGSAPLADVFASTDEIRFDGLEPGDVVATLELGDPAPAPLVLSRATATLVAGETEHVQLAADADALPNCVRVEGTLFVPAGWGLADLDISFRPLGLLGESEADHQRIHFGSMQRIRGRPGWRAWEVGHLLPATYEVRIDRGGFATIVEVGHDGRDDVVLMLGEPAQLEVRILEEGTETAIEQPWGVTWVPEGNRSTIDARVLAKGSRFGGAALPESDAPDPDDQWSARLSWDANVHRHVGSIPPGRGRIACEDLRIEMIEPERLAVRNVRTGMNRIELHARRRCGVEFSVAAEALRGEDTRLEWRQLDVPHPASGVEDPIPFGDAGLVVLPAPGRYRFSLQHGGARPPFELEIPAGTFVPYVIEAR